MALKKAFMKNILIFSCIINTSQELFVLLQKRFAKSTSVYSVKYDNFT